MGANAQLNIFKENEDLLNKGVSPASPGKHLGHWETA